MEEAAMTERTSDSPMAKRVQQIVGVLGGQELSSPSYNSPDTPLVIAQSSE
jgi:hypothetical protein